MTRYTPDMSFWSLITRRQRSCGWPPLTVLSPSASQPSGLRGRGDSALIRRGGAASVGGEGQSGQAISVDSTDRRAAAARTGCCLLAPLQLTAIWPCGSTDSATAPCYHGHTPSRFQEKHEKTMRFLGLQSIPFFF